METSKQISVFLENKPGRLANVLSALAHDKVNIVALAVMDTREQSVLRLVTEDPVKTRQVIKTLGPRTSEHDVLVVELRNHPGALAHVCGILGGEHINIDYAYCSAGGRNGKTMGIFKVSNTEKAMRVLNSATNNATRRRAQVRTVRDQRSYSTPPAAAR
jgi:hypothetical protein